MLSPDLIDNLDMIRQRNFRDDMCISAGANVCYERSRRYGLFRNNGDLGKLRVKPHSRRFRLRRPIVRTSCPEA